MKERLPEIVKMGVFDSRRYYRGVQFSRERVVLEYELEWFTRDGGAVFLNDACYPVRKNTFLFARPGDRRHSQLHFFCRFIHFTADPLLQKAISDITPFFYCPDRQKIGNLWDETEKGFLSDSLAEQLTSRASLVSLVCLLARRAGTVEAASDLVAQAERLIDETYAENPTVDELANRLNISTSYLYKLFSSAYGFGPHEAVLRRQIAAAKQLISSEDMLLKNVATRCGFSSPAYFSTCFEKYVGVSPRAYRAKTAFKL